MLRCSLSVCLVILAWDYSYKSTSISLGKRYPVDGSRWYMYTYNDKNLFGDLSWVAWGLGTRIQEAWDFKLVICKHIAHFLLTFTLTIQDDYDRSNESSKLISTILLGMFIKLVNLAYSVKSLSFTFMLSLHLLTYAPIKRA